MIVIVIAGRPLAVIGILGVVVAIPAVTAIRSGAVGRDLIPVLGATGKVQLVTGLLTAVGIALSA